MMEEGIEQRSEHKHVISGDGESSGGRKGKVKAREKV